MTVQVNYKNNIIANSAGNYAFFTDEKLQIKNLKSTFSNHEISYISEIIKKKVLKKAFFHLI